MPKSSESAFRLQEFQTTIWKNRLLSISINFFSIEIPWHTSDFQVANLCWKILIHSTREDSATFILEASCGFCQWKTTSYRDTLSSSPNLSKSGTACLFVWKNIYSCERYYEKNLYPVACLVTCSFQVVVTLPSQTMHEEQVHQNYNKFVLFDPSNSMTPDLPSLQIGIYISISSHNDRLNISIHGSKSSM